MKPLPVSLLKMNPRKYGKGGEFASNRLDDQEISMLALHLLQISMVYRLSRDFCGIGEKTFPSTVAVLIRSSMAVATPTVTQCLMKITGSIWSVAI